jgi:heptosyltransferase-2
MNVLLRTPNWIGDAVLALPAAAALAGRPGWRLTLLAPPPVQAVYAGLPGAILLPLDPRARTLPQAWSVARAIAADDDVGIVLPRSFSSALVLRLAGLPRRVGRSGQGRGALLTEALPPPPAPLRPLPPADEVDPAEHDAARTRAAAGDDRLHRWRDYAELVEHVLEEPVRERYPLHVPARSDAEAEGLLAGAGGRGPLVGLNPGSAAPSRRWPAERYAELGRGLRQRLDARVVVFGGPRETDLAGAVAGAIPGAMSLAGPAGLERLMACLRRLDLLVTNDTGPMHLAAALGTPLIELAGAGDERVTGPRGDRVRILRERLFCSPCVRNVCPYGLECMRALTVARVEAAVLDLLMEARAA